MARRDFDKAVGGVTYSTFLTGGVSHIWAIDYAECLSQHDNIKLPAHDLPLPLIHPRTLPHAAFGIRFATTEHVPDLMDIGGAEVKS